MYVEISPWIKKTYEIKNDLEEELLFFVDNYCITFDAVLVFQNILGYT